MAGSFEFTAGDCLVGVDDHVGVVFGKSGGEEGVPVGFRCQIGVSDGGSAEAGEGLCEGINVITSYLFSVF